MYIVPISSAITPLNTMSQNTPETVSAEKTPSFTDVFSEVYNEVQSTQKVLDQNAADIVMGGIDDLHTIYNNITKAQISLETFVAIRDAAQQSYKELMQMNV
ncbi:MAG: flagellar hook-basal body complex protein FliE [Oscillospiraceae bacterium]|nr:flagellar hook-basal body complex protein FliE [Oscillospiraceae bacterium]